MWSMDICTWSEIVHAVINLDKTHESAGSELKLGDMNESYYVMFNFSDPCLSLTYCGIKGACFQLLLDLNWFLTGARGPPTATQWFQLEYELFLLLSTVGGECLTLKHDRVLWMPKLSKCGKKHFALRKSLAFFLSFLSPKVVKRLATACDGCVGR